MSQSLVMDTEPNDTPQTAQRIDGAVNIRGAMPSGDQDGYLWRVDDQQAQQPWTLTLTGIPGALTLVDVVRLTYGPDGESVTGARSLFKLGSRDGARPVSVEGLLFEPGEYLLGLARGGGGRPALQSAGFGQLNSALDGGAGEAGKGAPDAGQPAQAYQLDITAGSGFRPSPLGEGNTRERPQPLAVGRSIDTLVAGKQAWYRFALDEKLAGQRWDLSVRTSVGQSLKAVLMDEGGRELAQVASDAYGGLSFLDLALPQGAYLLRVDGAEQLVQRVLLASAGARVEGEEAEPNDRWTLANRVDAFKGVSGRFQKDGDTDLFRFALTAEQVDQRLAVALTLPDEATAKVCLHDAQGKPLQCRDAQGEWRLSGLALEAGEYGVGLSRGKAGHAYQWRMVADGPHDAALEAEPNDTHHQASPLLLGQRVRGSLSAGDTDVYRVEVTGEPQLWRFQVTGDGLRSLSYLNGQGKSMQTAGVQKGERRVRLDSLYLPPGTHYLAVRGQGEGDYLLLSRPQGQPLPVVETAGQPAGTTAPPPGGAETAGAGPQPATQPRVALDPDAEWEPNDTVEQMQTLRMGQTRTGGFHAKDDKDIYRFTLTGTDHIQLSLTAPAAEAGRMRAQLYWEGERLADAWVPAGETRTLSGVYPPGLYRLEMTTDQAFEGAYQMALSRLPRFGCGVDCEPNGHVGMANPLPADGRIAGRFDPMGRDYDTDWFALPVRPQDTTWHVTTNSKVSVAVQETATGRSRSLRRKTEDEPYEAVVPAGVQAYLVIQAKEDYQLQAGVAGETAPHVLADLSDLSLGLAFPVSEVGAYARLGQQLQGALAVRNGGAQVVSVRIEAAATDARWAVTAPGDLVTVPAGGLETVPVSVQVPDDAWALGPVQVAVRAVHDSGSAVHAHADIAVSPDAPLAAPALYTPMPAALQGGLNLASLMLGAQIVDDPGLKQIRHPEQLFDGEVSVNNGALFRRAGAAPLPPITVQLAGDGQVEVAGFLFYPLSNATMTAAPASATVALSQDGEQFDTVWQGRLAPHTHDQPVVLYVPRKARFARLTLDDTHLGAASEVRLGEWQVIAAPGSAVAVPQPFNLADPAFGGHVAYADPPVASSNWNKVLIEPVAPADVAASRAASVRVPKGRSFSWVLGLHQNRAARIDRLVWGEDRGTVRGEPLPSVDVDVSVAGPLGPWQPLGTWSLAGSGAQTWHLDTPVWARFIRFTSPPMSERTEVRLPTAVRAYEAPVRDGYRSILGAWGQGRVTGPYEQAHPLAPPPELDTTRTNVSREQAQTLDAGGHASGQVRVGEQEHWYRVVVPEGSNEVGLALSGPDHLRVRLEARTPEGEPVTLTPGTPDERSQHWSFAAVPGTTLLLRVYEPPRNVFFSWDGSGSVSAYSGQVRQALVEYARGLQPGRDIANLLPFGRRPVLKDWLGDPYLMMQAVGATSDTDSSAAEETLATASLALAERDGTRAVVLLTDAETSAYPGLWPALADGRPQVMAVTMSGSAPSQRLMQTWSLVHGGHYSYVRNAGEMAVALDRASVLLRQPASYTLAVDARLVAPPADGRLQVRSVPADQREAGAARPGPATAIILDASGSMLQRMGGERRIEVAKRGLTDALAHQLPPGTPVSLRVFGHKEAGSCRTDLEMPLAPLDVTAAQRTIARVQAKNLARTPIADSLAQVRKDLARAQGPRTIVLVTDGEETCGGDPEAVIRELTAEGYGVRLNIIGFALDDAALERQFGEWAQLGGGEYFSANDAQSFGAAMSAALQLTYTVWDAEGRQVAEGQVDGDPVTLPPGPYQLRIPLTPEWVVGPVPVEPDGLTSLNMP